MDGRHIFSCKPIFFTFGKRFRHREIMRGSLAVRTSGAESRALGLVKELERRVEALDETIQAEVGSFMSISTLR
jgi:hypothetical protein